MLQFNFQIVSPWSSRFNNLLSSHGKIGKSKAWEFNAYKTNSVVTVSFSLSFRGDHAGIRLEVGVLGYEVEMTAYDTRHWDWKNNCWEKYDN